MAALALLASATSRAREVSTVSTEARVQPVRSSRDIQPVFGADGGCAYRKLRPAKGQPAMPL
jgi:hypothetical protein